MNVVAYAGPQEFLSENSRLLESREAENSVLLGNALQAYKDGSYLPAGGYWAAGLRPGRPDLLAGLLPPHPLLLAVVGRGAELAAGGLARALLAGGWQVPGAVGRDAIAMSFAGHWGSLAGSDWSLRRRLRVYELRAVAHLAPSPGTLRPAGPGDVPLVAAWTAAFEQEALGQRETQDTTAYAQRRIAAGEIWLWENHHPVTAAAQARPTPRGMSINLVYTPPEFRGRGYASSCVAALSDRLLGEGRAFCALSADLANPTANKIYERIGYKPVCDVSHIVFSS